ncbi:hypothetical protein F5141DRAFT_1145442 [Pisolithus sp. B1]|nr:hypothetical protein F5141DRAFT_1145442 [Pisolithus sp. B1]
MPDSPPTSLGLNPKSRKIRPDDFDSDEEFVREVGTDSEYDDDDHSSVGSATDSDTEPVSSSNGPHSRPLTPNTTQSSADGQDEMVAEEVANGPSDLPVVDFANLSTLDIDHPHRSGTTPSLRTTRSSKRPPVKRAVSAPNVDRPAPTQPSSPHTEPEVEDFPTDSQPSPSASKQLPRRTSSTRPGQSARQAYQQRLESDPSFVPRVGDFWGHDDRLLDKNWRSLSGWWRGRWQGRGRGFVGGRGRGTAFIGSESGHRGSTEMDSDPQETQKPTTEVPRVDQPWTHDGYEEMRKREERKREAQQQAQQQNQQEARPTRGFSPRGRGALAFRGRRGVIRGRGFTSSPTRPLLIPPVSTPDRTWYAMKPERVWTKQHDAFLYIDSNLKPRPGVGPGYRVKLSNAEARVVRGPVGAVRTSAKEASPTFHSPSSEDGDKAFVVRLPSRFVKREVEEAVSAPSESLTTVGELPIDDAFIVRPELAPPRIPIVTPLASSSPKDALLSAGPSSQPIPHSPEAVKASSLEEVQEAPPAQSTTQPTDSIPVTHHDSETLAPSTENDAQETAQRRNVPPVPPPLQTVFPHPQPSPPYSSHYGYASPLPPGIAVNQHGMAYDVTTGRPVYLQAPLYTPRPLAHGMMTPPGMSFIPGHMHHHSGSPDFLAPPHTPPLTNFVDPTTGGPLFSFPRQSARVEIRAPSSMSDAKNSARSQRRPSGLRTSAAAYESSQPTSPSNATASYVVQNEGLDPRDGVNAGTPGHPVDATMLGYSAYHQPYYYPDQYGYSHYYDVSQVPQYEMYHADPHASQGVVYY